MPSTSTALPPPTGGWDARSSLADMPPENAIILDNIFPSTDKVTTRRGNSSGATGMSGPVETLIEYIPLTAAGELFAANGGNIYDITTDAQSDERLTEGGNFRITEAGDNRLVESSGVGAPVVTSLTNNRWQYAMIGTAAGQFVRLVNGDDTPLVYDGSTWGTTPTITGTITPEDAIWINLHQRRMWLGEKDSLIAYYLPINSIGGSATAFSLQGIAKRGGFLMGMGTWTRDSGSGMDDVAVFFTSEGEAIVYTGTDPASASTWSLIGVFAIGKPIGRRCFMKGGSDLIIVTQDGFVPLSAILSIDRSQARLVALSDQINKAVNDSVRSFGSLFGWQPILYPKGTMMVFNIPQSATKFHQYVFNTITGAPARFTGINAICWGMLNDNLYWGGADGTVNKFDDGNDDLGSNIEVDALQAFNYFKSPQVKKAFKNVEPIFEGSTNPNAAIDLNIDFQVKLPTGTSQASATSAGLWGVAKWSVGLWGSASQVWNGWKGVRGIGRAAAIRIRISTNSGQKSWLETRFTWIPGGQL